MKYVYLLASTKFRNEIYIGLTSDLRKRFAAHNAGQSTHTKKFRPWRLVAYFAFADANRASDFERYLKSGTGRAFVKKRLM